MDAEPSAPPAAAPGQIKVIFTTTEPDLQLPESKRQLLIPADIKRYGLSRILNSTSMLDTAQIVPLDFLVNRTSFLRTTLAEHLAAEGLSSETTITLAYVRSLLPPVYQASFPHDDWVSCVDVLSATSRAAKWTADGEGIARDRILSASYDGLVRVWDGSGNAVATSPPVHALRLDAARFMDAKTIVSAGGDQKIVVWDYAEQDDGLQGTMKPKLELYGHTRGVASLDIHEGNRKILTACVDGSIGIWSSSKRTAPAVDPEALPSAHSAKRIKTSSSTPQRGPLAIMNIHGERASAAIFHPHDVTVAYSVAHDHTFRTIDLTTARCVSTLSTMHPLLCAAALPGSSSLVAAGTSARHVSLLDPREGTASAVALTLRGHTNMVSAVAPAPGKDYALISASHDGTCKVWDLRSVRPGRTDEGGGSVAEPVYSIDREWLKGKKAPLAGQGVKVLSVTWDAQWGIVSGGEDKTVQVNRGRDIISS